MTRFRKTLVSVIIPALNEEKRIAACIESARAQITAFPYEIILIDNNSSDRTREIASQYGIQVLVQEKQGRAYARQMGAEKANGQILAFTEADCTLPPNWVESIANIFKTNPDIIGLCGSYTFNEQNWVSHVLLPAILRLTYWMNFLVRKNATFRGTNFAVRKEMLLKGGGFNQKFAPFDDVEAGYRIGKLGVITYNSKLKISTSDRRVRGRVFAFLKEFVSAYLRVFFLQQSGKDDYYLSIR